VSDDKDTSIKNGASKSESDTFFKLLQGILFLATVAIVVVVTFYFNNFEGDLSVENSDWGAFGDFIGGTLNPILSFLSLIALLLTIALQQKELVYARKDLYRSKKAQEATQIILDEQSDTMAKQQFESTFFSLLDQHNKILENLVTNVDFPLLKGKIFYETSGLPDASYYLKTQQVIFGSYFKVLYQLLKFVATNCPDSKVGNTFEIKNIEETPVSKSEKMYSNIIRSFLGLDVTQLLAVNCYCENDKDSYWKYKLLIERYALFEHMSVKAGGNVIKIFYKLPDFYNKSAFGNSDYLSDELGR